ncbi:MAG: hypothetical protein M3198_19480, partial [Actinomycetota bacterium]|nr:hypothetical protein [Actinomycetota bacterium]
VTDLEGKRVTFAKATGRFFLKVLSIYPVPLVGIVLAAFTKRKQALHDVLSGCLVVNATATLENPTDERDREAPLVPESEPEPAAQPVEDPAVSPQLPHPEAVQRLLSAYQGVLDALEHLPVVVWLRRTSTLGRRLTVPACRPLVHFFLIRHLGTTLAAVERRYHLAAAAASPELPKQRAHQERLEHLRMALPPPRTRGITLALVTLFGLFNLAISGVVDRVHPRLGVFLRNSAGNVADLDFIGITREVSRLHGGDELDVQDLFLFYAAAALVSLAFYLPLAIAGGSFRCKRLILNFYPRAARGHSLPAVEEQLYRVEGVYLIEVECLRGAGNPRPETPLDLLSSAALPGFLLLWSVVGLSGLLDVREDGPLSGDGAVGMLLALTSLVPFLVLTAARVLWVIWAWRWRVALLRRERRGEYAARRSGGWATGSLAFGIAGLLYSGLGVFLGPVAIVFARRGKKEVDAQAHPSERFRLRLGEVLGWVDLGLGTLLIVLLIGFS